MSGTVGNRPGTFCGCPDQVACQRCMEHHGAPSEVFHAAPFAAHGISGEAVLMSNGWVGRQWPRPRREQSGGRDGQATAGVRPGPGGGEERNRSGISVACSHALAPA